MRHGYQFGVTRVPVAEGEHLVADGECSHLLAGRDVDDLEHVEAARGDRAPA
jgi:hypothetical protein